MRTILILIIISIQFSRVELYAQREYFHFERSSSLLIDGNIQGAQSGGVDNSATGQLGFRSDNFLGKWEIKFTAASTIQESVKSNNVDDYSNFILNPFNTRTGFDGLQFSLLRRYFGRKGAVVNYSRFLVRIDSMSISEFNDVVNMYDLSKNKNLLNKLGFLIDFNVSNMGWTNSNDLTEEGNIVAFNPYIITSYRTMFLGNNVDVFAGVGPSFRLIAGNIKDDPEFIKDILGTEKASYLGAQFTIQAFINNFYAKANYAIYGGESSIDGLTGGQFYVSIGLQAKIGEVRIQSETISDILNYELSPK